MPPDATYTTIDNNNDWTAGGFSSSDDGSYGPIALPFSFYLYGQTWSTAFININGNVSFGTYYSTFSSSGFPVSGFTMVAPFWADVDLGGVAPGANVVQFKVTPTALYVNWTNVGYFSSQTDKLNTFQLVITDGFDPIVANGANVSFCYQDMQWTTGSASGGTMGFGGTPARVGANHGNGIDYIQFGAFDQVGFAYDGPFGLNDGVDWLDNQYFSFSTAVTTANVPPIIAGQSVCDSLVVCAGITSQFQVTFLSPEPGQITTANSFAPTLSNYTIVSNTSGLTADITTSFTPALIDTGYHVVTFQATDNGSPSLTSTLNIIVHVLPPQGNSTGTLDACTSDTPTDLFTTLNPPAAPGGNWTNPSGGAHSGMFDPAVDPAGVYHYDLSLGGCQNIADVTIAVTPASNAGNDNAMAFCSSDPIIDLFTLVLGTPQAGGQWHDVNNIPFSGMFDPNSLPAGDYDYVLAGSGPCANDTSTISVSISQAVFAGGDSIVILCEDESMITLRAQLNGTPELGGTWYDPAGIATNDTLFPASSMPGIYQYILTTSAPCFNDTAFLEVVIHALPFAGADNMLTLCMDASPQALFPMLGPGVDGNGNWIGPDLATHIDTIRPALDATGNYAYIVPGVGQCTGRVDSAFVEVTLHDLPVPQFEFDPAAGCAPHMVHLVNTTDTLVGTDCIWQLGDGTQVNECIEFDHLFLDPGLYPITLTITSPAGCTDVLEWPNAVQVEPRPQADFLANPDPATALNPSVYFVNSDPYAVQHTWIFDGTDTAHTASTIYTFPDQLSDEYEVCLAVVDIYGCTDTVCRMIDVLVPALYIPTGFSPDGDGVNDVFQPVAVDMVLNDYRMSIFDRWGHEVFTSTEITKGWDGSFQSDGKILPRGVYVWHVAARGLGTSEKKDHYGHIMLLK